MSDIVERSKAALKGVTEGEWVQVGLGNIHRLPVGDHPPVAKTWKQSDGDFVAEARSLVPALIAEVERLRSYKSLPEGMVWQDYYSPDDVCKIREQYEASPT